jgi:predicted ester cyclase
MTLLDGARQFFTALNANDMDTVVAMLDPQVAVQTPIATFTGNEAYREWMLMHFRALPDFTHEIRGLAAESGDTLAFELHAFGTFSGPLALPGGEVAPTGRRIDVPAADFWRFADGRVVDYHLYFDRVDFFAQLGTPLPA